MEKVCLVPLETLLVRFFFPPLCVEFSRELGWQYAVTILANEIIVIFIISLCYNLDQLEDICYLGGKTNMWVIYLI